MSEKGAFMTTSGVTKKEEEANAQHFRLAKVVEEIILLVAGLLASMLPVPVVQEDAE
jgi:hypothetical protein